MLIKVFIKYDDSQEVMLAMKNNYEKSISCDGKHSIFLELGDSPNPLFVL